MKFHFLTRERERGEGAGGTVPRLSKTSVCRLCTYINHTPRREGGDDFFCCVGRWEAGKMNKGHVYIYTLLNIIGGIELCGGKGNK